MSLRRRPTTLLHPLAALIVVSGCDVPFEREAPLNPNGPPPGNQPPPVGPGMGNPPPTDPTNLAQALTLAQAADTSVQRDTRDLTLMGTQMQAAAALVEADLQAVLQTRSIEDLQRLINDAIVELRKGEQSGQAGDRIAENLRAVATVAVDAVGFLAHEGPAGERSARMILELVRDARGRAQAGKSVLESVVKPALTLLIDELADADNVAIAIGANHLVAQIEAEIDRAEEDRRRITATASRIEALETVIDTAITALEVAVLQL